MNNVASDNEYPEDTLLLDRRGDNRIVEFMGINFAPINDETLLNRIIEHVEKHEDFGYFVNPNVDVVVKTHANPMWQKLINEAWLSVSDSRILELLAKFSGIELPACPGSSLVENIFKNVLQPDEIINIVGGDAELVEIVKQKYGLKNVNFYEPPMGLKDKPDEVEKCAKFLVDNPARFHFLCVGNPQQLMVANAVLKYKGVKGVALCVGASLDFIGGRAKRAPKIVQQLRLEWLFRLLSEPKRLWRRYLVEGPAIFKIWLDWRAAKNKR
jgi:exopolysaccharide biosynthesis WecB/TagA/CpsF family protein